MRRILILSALCMIGTGCGSPSIDSSSEESFKKSFTALRESLPADKQQELDAAILELAFENLDLADLASAGSDPEAAALKFRMPLDGLTAEQILEKAALLRQEREAKQREEALKEVEELEEKRRKGDRDRAELAKIEITRSRFYKTKENYVTKPVIELRVKNGSEHSIARLYFKGTIASPGRAVPWLREDFNYAISGGLEPREEQSWRLAPNMFSEWGRVEPSKDAVFTVEVVRADGADGESLYDASGLTDWEQERLEELKAQYSK